MRLFFVCSVITLVSVLSATTGSPLMNESVGETPEFTPVSGPTTGRTRVVIHESFTAGTSVLFGERPAMVIRSNTGQTVCVTPRGQAGTVDVAVKQKGRAARRIGVFTYFKFPIGALSVSLSNRRYVVSQGGRPFLLIGAYTTDSQVDGSRESRPLDWEAFLDFYRRNGFNMIRGWTAESALDLHLHNPGRYSPQRYSFSDVCCSGYDRTERKWDLNRLNQGYFDRLRKRAIAAGMHGIYISAMMFQGWDVTTHHCHVANSWTSNPFNAANNVNGIDGDPRGTGQGAATERYQQHEPPALRAVLAYQEAWVSKVVYTLNDLDNVVWEIANESPAQPGADAWQQMLVRYIRRVESQPPEHHHLIWRTAEIAGCGQNLHGKDGTDATLFASSAELVSPTYNGSGSDYNGSYEGPKPSDESKVVILDDDHVDLHDPVRIWKAFTRGYNLLYANDDLPDCHGNCVAVVNALAEVARFASRLDLATTVPHPELSSTGFALADPGKEYLVYDPLGKAFSVDFSGTKGTFLGEWFATSTGKSILAERTWEGGTTHLFTPPLKGPSVLYVTRAEN
jgi:IPT/TIG domain